MPQEAPLTVFVAMPYSDLGPRAKWKKPEDVESLYAAVGQALERDLSRPVRLLIERNRPEPGLVQESILRSLWEADVLIADLTGSNANVFFELGIRYGVRKGLTILTSQEDQTPFDLASMRVVRYAHRPEQRFIEDIVQVVKTWVADRGRCDSPMLGLVPLEVIPRERWQRVAEQRVAALLGMARRAATGQERLQLTRQALEDDPCSENARVEHIWTLRSLQEYREALLAADEALTFFPNAARLHKERALVLDRLSEDQDDRLTDAQAAIERALALDPSDADAHCCLGGVLRRRSIRQRVDGERDLRASLAAYQRALEIDRHSTYAGLNVLRSMVLLKPRDANVARDADLHLRRMYHLCEFEISETLRTATAESWWRFFDLGDTLVLSERPDDALRVYREALERIPESERREVVLSPLRTWRELIAADSLSASTRAPAEALIRMLEEVRLRSDGHAVEGH